jgi:hypothetical protein
MDNSVSTRSFNFHGWTVALAAGACIWELLNARFRRFPLDPLNPPALAFEFVDIDKHPDAAIEPPRRATQVIYESRLGEVVYAGQEDCLYVNYQARVQARCDLARGRARIAYELTSESVWIATHHLLTLFLIEWLKRRGLYSLHAAGVGINDRGLLFAGATGSGKSTLALALARAGYGLLGDDMLFLAPQPEELRALAFPEDIDITDESAALFPEVQSLLITDSSGRRKQAVDPQAICGAVTVWECVPGVLVLPTVRGSETSSIRQINRGEALMELAPNVLLTEPRTSQLHLDALAALVKQCKCYRLETGRDVEALPGLLAALVERGTGE